MHRTIETPDDLGDLTRLLGTLKKPFTVEWRLGRNRTLDQNKLQFKWAAEVAAQVGDTAEDVRAEWKLRHGVPILRETSPEFREIYDTHLKPFPYETKLKIVRVLSVTSVMKVKEMTRYLDAVQRECLSNGLHLTDPEVDR